MSRTKRGNKDISEEFWSRRPHSCLGVGRAIKKWCHATERQQGKMQARKESSAVEDGE